MKTITESITLMVLCILAALICTFTMIINIATQYWWLVAINAICVIANVIFARISYKQAKRIEESMQRDIQTVMNLQLLDLMRKAFENHPDFNPNGFGENPKDKEDEVEADK